jgi:hypothetical protein
MMKAKKITAHTPSIIAIRYLVRHYTVKEHRDGTFTVYLYLPRDIQMTVYRRVTPKRLIDMMYVFDMKGYIMDAIEEE